MKTLWKLTREAARCKMLYVVAILSTLALTFVNLTAPKVLSAMTGVVERGVDDAALSQSCSLPWRCWCCICCGSFSAF